jgi:hypothetical protein
MFLLIFELVLWAGVVSETLQKSTQVPMMMPFKNGDISFCKSAS